MHVILILPSLVFDIDDVFLPIITKQKCCIVISPIWLFGLKIPLDCLNAEKTYTGLESRYCGIGLAERKFISLQFSSLCKLA